MKGVSTSSSLHPAKNPVFAVRPWEICHGLLAWLVALNLADLITTRAVLDAGGAESNPVMQPFVHNIVSAGCVKAFFILVIVALVFRTKRLERMLPLLGLVDLWYFFVVIWNLTVLARA